MTEQSALATLANISDLTDGRDRAIAMWLETYDTLHANMQTAAMLSIGGGISVRTGFRDSDAFTEAFLTTVPHRSYDRRSGRSTELPAREAFEKIATAEVDRRCWDTLMKQLGFDQLLDRQAREEFQASLKDAPPEFTVENCSATFGNLWANRREIYLRGIANVFMKMDRRFRSHDAFAIGNRLIIENALADYAGWANYNRRDTLRDVERIFRELDGVGPVAEVESVASRTALRPSDRPSRIEDEYFKIDVFKNGNVHLWFKRKDLLEQVNELLLEYYRPVEGDVGDGPSYESGPLYHQTPANKFGEFHSSEDVAARVMELAGIGQGKLVLEPSAGTGMLASAARAKGGVVTCVEIQPHLAAMVRHKGFMTREADFLKTEPGDLGLFDVIVMNPPFDRGRDCDHVRHAFQFLKPGGRLVAVMSARAEFGTDARHKALHDLIAANKNRWSGWTWHDLPEKSFAHAGTNVNTVMLKIDKPR